MKLASLSLVATLLVAACGKTTPAENAADQLDNAAEQSEPAAAAVLENQANAIRATGSVEGSSSDPDGTVQNAMENAGTAAAATGGNHATAR